MTTSSSVEPIKFKNGVVQGAPKGGWYQWIGFSAEDLGLYTSVVDRTVQDEGTFDLFPNPSVEDLFLSFEDMESGIVLIYDVHGKVCLRREIDNLSIVSLDISRLPVGVYTLSFCGTNEKIKWELKKFSKVN